MSSEHPTSAFENNEPVQDAYEVEFKVEITEAEREALMDNLRQKGFSEEPEVSQDSVYVDTTESSKGGDGPERYRREGNRFFHTRKILEKVGNSMACREIQREISQSEYMDVVLKNPEAVRVPKQRNSFSGKYQGQNVHIDMDSVKFKHSPSIRFFVEAEIITNDEGRVEILEKFVQQTLKDLLGRSDLVRSPGIYGMAKNQK